MAYGVWQGTITDRHGNVIPGGMLEVRLDQSGAGLATVYADSDGAQILSNPITADSEGFVRFYAPTDTYKLTFYSLSNPAYERTYRDVYITPGLGPGVAKASVLDRDLTAPPGSPTTGDRYIIASSATGDWSGKDGQIATWATSAWGYDEPGNGWLVYVEDEVAIVAWNGAAWVAFDQTPWAVSGSNIYYNTGKVGIGTTNPTFSLRVNGAPNSNVASFGSGMPGSTDWNGILMGAPAVEKAGIFFQKDATFFNKGNLVFGINDDNDITTRASVSDAVLTLTHTGNAGIGTTSPAVKLDVNGPACVKSYTVATVPSAATKAGQIIYVSNEVGGATLAFSNGTNWKRVSDLATISS